jgi:hypothetical protein
MLNLKEKNRLKGINSKWVRKVGSKKRKNTKKNIKKLFFL